MIATQRHPGGLIHREGTGSLTVAAAITVLIFLAGRAFGASTRSLTLLSAGFFGLVLQFFRHPGCSTPLDLDLVVAPAHGRIVHVGTEEEPEVLGDRRIRVSTFLSLFDAHLTRSPITGEITYQRYHPGRYLVALHPKSSVLNERNSILLQESGGRRILVRQIAGLLARRIRSYVGTGDVVGAGQEIGFIRLGSRVDVFLPPDSTVLVQVGQAVRAGETALARLARGE